ncbi:MAG: bifunctional 3-demethylubiquinone-9 3-methyltransferase/ 2-octaprenyl-6-hydroxy phenol methylase [Candidatus Accumulibacter phosphatis]|uniref:Bifunctional 3-demethylubiquinone-9 3-methyltransferase/ 2-octaprenyl-6-hydroxy phenol methylase n=1 Tax=Candidatus Accumulibacter phosphatis TaxID=327160 RepID=A0A080M4W4_9PROT|nr:MAG: bifunctional 3-demethylubiquinone-9 3-methyltransferase/ 2-octaprenyl-6-hydroxy phenol methylase [Candidatus Accumulibacter phosphatis]
MGFLRDSYTREYFTGLASDGTRLGYGALGADEWRNGGIFDEIRARIDIINLAGKSVLEIGYGRGESARYMLSEKNVAHYVGLDFSEAAFGLAKETLSGLPENAYELHCADALEFLAAQRYAGHFDAVFMLDVIEHIPITETSALLPLLVEAIKPGGYLVVDTPFYSVDEDFIGQGFLYVDPSASDMHPRTSGMHCNKYTRERLITEMKNAGLFPCSDQHFQKPKPGICSRMARLWRNAIKAITPSGTPVASGQASSSQLTRLPSGEVFVVVNGERFRVEPHWFWDEFVTCWEPHTFEVFKRYARPGTTVLDVGAWVGPTVMIAASLGSKQIVAVEANKTTYAVLMRTISYNLSLASKVRLINRCIHYEEGWISFGNVDGSTSSSSASSIRGTGMQVRTISLEFLLTLEILSDVSFIKIDIEGSEVHAARDIARLAQRSGLEAIYLSLHPPFWPAMGDPGPLFDAMACFKTVTPDFQPLSYDDIVTRCKSDDTHPPWGTSFGNFFEVILLCR